MLEPALGSLSAASFCRHSDHNTSLVGPTRSGASERYPDEVYGIIARALMYPAVPTWTDDSEMCGVELDDPPSQRLTSRPAPELRSRPLRHTCDGCGFQS